MVIDDISLYNWAEMLLLHISIEHIYCATHTNVHHTMYDGNLSIYLEY